MPDAAHHQCGAAKKVKAAVTFRRIRGGNRVAQARRELARPVLRGGQLDEQFRSVRPVGPAALRRGERGGQVLGGVLEGQRGRCRRRGGHGPAGRPPQGGRIRCRPEQVRGHLRAAFRSRPGRRLKRHCGAAVQRDPLVLAKARVSAESPPGAPPGAEPMTTTGWDQP
jgi:hypothetical protein